jgi:hypothetical protein
MHDPTRVAETHWLRPPMVSAPSPDDINKTAIYAISPAFLQSHAGVFRRTPIFQIWAHVVGELPPINNISRLLESDLAPTLTTLNDAVACFRGVKRPYDDEPNGDSVLIYVLNPAASIEYEVDMACVAKAVKVPANTALTVQVKPRKSLQISANNVDGIVTRLEFVSCGGGDNQIILPKRHADRYGELLWMRDPR